MKLSHTIAALTAPVLVFSAPLPIEKDKPVLDESGINPEIDDLLCNSNGHGPLNMVYPYSWLMHRCYHPPGWYPNWNKIEPENNEGFQGTAGVTLKEVVNTPRSVMPIEDVPEVMESEDRPQKIEKRSKDDILPLSPGPDPVRSFHGYNWSFWPEPDQWDDPEWKKENCPEDGPCLAIPKDYKEIAQTVDMTPEEVVNTPGPVIATENVLEVMRTESPQDIEKRSNDVVHTPPVPDLSWPRPGPIPESFWAKMRDYFSKIEPGKIDLKELEKKYGYRHVHSWKWDLFHWSKGGNAGAN